MQSEMLATDEPVTAPVATEPLAGDPRWQLVERIAESEGFQKSSRLPALIRYLARCTLAGDRKGLSEQRIGRVVFHKREDYTPSEDSSVRVYIRQLRLRLHDFYEAEGQHEPLVVEIPKGSYALTFMERIPAALPPRLLPPVASEPAARSRSPMPLYTVLLALAVVVCAAGWAYTALGSRRNSVPWPMNQVVSKNMETTVVLADAAYSLLRLLGDRPVPLDEYIDRSYLKGLIPEHMEKNEARLLHYTAASQLTSMADAQAVATLMASAAPLSSQMAFRSARDLSPVDLGHGSLIFIGARTSNPWVELFDESLNFRIVEDLGAGNRAIVNRDPLPGEQKTYFVPSSTGTSGEDYATISLLPNKTGVGKVLLIQGLRLEGTEAALHCLRSEELRAALEKATAKANHGTVPAYFELLLHAKSVAGSPMDVEFVSARSLSH